MKRRKKKKEEQEEEDNCTHYTDDPIPIILSIKQYLKKKRKEADNRSIKNDSYFAVVDAEAIAEVCILIHTVFFQKEIYAVTITCDSNKFSFIFSRTKTIVVLNVRFACVAETRRSCGKSA